MPDYLNLLFGRAYESMEGEFYNRYRELQGEKEDREATLYYEISLLEPKGWEYLRDQVYPAFTRYLRDKSIDPERPKGVVVAVFYGSRCYLLKGEDFVEVFREMEGLNPSAYHFRVLRWLNP